MKRTSRLVVGAAVGGTVLATVGVATVLTSGSGGATRPAASARPFQDTGRIAAELRAGGAVDCRAERTRVECRQGGRYVAATVVTPDAGMSVEDAEQGWRSGVAQSALGDDGPFALLRGPNWLVTGPEPLLAGVRAALGGDLVRCDRPFGTCR